MRHKALGHSNLCLSTCPQHLFPSLASHILYQGSDKIVPSLLLLELPEGMGSQAVQVMWNKVEERGFFKKKCISQP